MKKSVLGECSSLIQKEIDYIASFCGLEIDVTDENTVRAAGTGFFRSLVGEDCTCGYSGTEEAKRCGRCVFIPARDSSVCKKCNVFSRCTCLSEMIEPLFLQRKYIGAVNLLCYQENIRERMVREESFYRELLSHLGSVIKTAAQNVLNSAKAADYEMLLKDMVLHSETPVLLAENGRISEMNPSADSYFNPDGQKLLEKGSRMTAYVSKNDSEIMLKAGSGKYTLSARYQLRPSDMPMKKRLETVMVQRDRIASLPFVRSSHENVTMDYLEGSCDKLNDFKKQAVFLFNTSRFILLEGERGLGKETWARAIHHASSYADQEILVFDCTEFFDQAFANAFFRESDGILSRTHITICLKEVSKLSAWIQRKLSDSAARMNANDIRLICTTTEAPDVLLHQNALLNRLYMLFYPAFLRIPPVCERPEDVGFYISDYINKYIALENRKVSFSRKALSLLESYRWPGNFKQMEQLIGFIVASSENGTVTEEDLRKIPDLSDSGNDLSIAAHEKKLIEEALLLYKGPNGKTAAAKALGISKATLYRKIQEYGLS